MRRVLLAAALLGATWVAGCPRPLESPPEPREGQRCESLEDCNQRDCGELLTCVNGFCTMEAELEVPCYDSGATRDR